ncbi:hypothetical protein J4E85_010923 [Alternaria conjuncta]|uniref:uncharacterized protein n=1 Tax=Alternaria conjuncta TaxID=181017 RepID=UPI00221FC05F|nr:uncharacterized protein J4E85_010923 [Alternaria conjuncta]KAI4913190.1 hypothetical protein J4E85_010923 [Alternaria conjuncta]
MSEILRSTRHVVFLDTPHVGVGLEALKRLNGGHLSDHVTSQFGLWSQKLEEQAKRFANIAENFNISSACATVLDSEGAMEKLVAPGHSAHTLVPHERIFYMDRARHEDICKFPNKDHVNYRRLRDRIMRGLAVIRRNDKRIGALRDWLGTIDSSNLEKHKEACEIMDKHRGTCDWLFNDAAFQAWTAESKSHACLWLTGPSGVGKTFLSSAAIKHIQELPDQPGTAFDFVEFDVAFQKPEILQRLASRLLDRVIDRDALTEAALDFRNRAKNAEEMKSLVVELLHAAASVGRIFVFIDGINEVAGKTHYEKEYRNQMDREEKAAEDVIKLLMECGQNEPNVRLWFSSQPDDRSKGWLHQDIASPNGTISGLSVKELAIPAAESRVSVSIFLKAAVETLIGKKYVGENAPLVSAIGRLRIRAKAGDSFRWAKMMADAFKDCPNIDEIEAMLEQDLSNDLSQLYHKSLLRLQNMDVIDQGKRPCTGYSREKYCISKNLNQLLIKKNALEFRCGRDNVHDHEFIQYAAKYWYRHIDDPEPDTQFSALVERFVRSPHFVTTIQVQSLFVPGHFIQDLDCDDPEKRTIKKNLPDLLESGADRKLWRDYHEFLAEWGIFLQRGVTENVNGEMSRCLWSTLSTANYFRRHKHLQRFQMALILEDGSGPSETADRALYDVSFTDELNVTVWGIQGSG